MKNEDEIKALAFGVIQLIRKFPHGRHLITLFPFFALLLVNGIISPSEIILFLLAFAFAIAAGFTYNAISDEKKDPETKNPITRGVLSRGRAFVVLASCLFLAVILFVFTSQSIVAILLFGLYMCLWFAYSGLGIRLKESIFGPAAASIVLWSGPPLLLLVSFNFFSVTTTLLVFGLFILYIGIEIKHALIEHDLDVSYNCKTFAVILGKKRAAMAEYVTLILGSFFLLAGAYYAPTSNTVIIVLFAAAFSVSITSSVLYGMRYNFDLRRNVIFTNVPYIVTKMFLITYGCVVLLFSPILIFFALWFYLMQQFP